jgi:hypothetical protein
MSESKYRGDPRELAIFERLLPQSGMFLVDERPGKDSSVIYRSRNNEIEAAYIKRHRPSQSKPDFSVYIEGDYWGNMNGKLFEDVPALAYALKKRGLTQVEF